jgi:hypothetical protein
MRRVTHHTVGPILRCFCEGWSIRDEDLLLMPSGVGKGFVRLSTKAAKEFSIVVFSSGKEAEEITVK